LKFTEVAHICIGDTFSTVKVINNQFWQKTGFGHIWAIFFTSASGHPGSRVGRCGSPSLNIFEDLTKKSFQKWSLHTYLHKCVTIVSQYYKIYPNLVALVLSKGWVVVVGRTWSQFYETVSAEIYTYLAKFKLVIVSLCVLR
jgi:hypothetical protein